MDDLPPPLIVEILSRLDDSADLARCRVACKTFNLLSREVRFINLRCSFHRYVDNFFPLIVIGSPLPPFKTIFKTLISELRIVESVTISVDEPPTLLSVSDEFESMKKDLEMSDVSFLEEWLPGVCHDLRSLSLSNDWGLTCALSPVISLVSAYCHNLIELQITKIWLSLRGLKRMPKLAKLTFEDIQLKDRDLKKLNQCFPALQVLNLIGVSGFRQLKIHLMHLKSCQLTLYNVAYSIIIIAPSLVKMKLQCERPKTLIIDTPSLNDLYLSLGRSNNFKVQEFVNLTSLYLESSLLHGLLSSLPFSSGTVKDLTLSSIKYFESVYFKQIGVAKFGFELLFRSFPNVSSLTLTPWAWSEMEMYVYPEDVHVRNQMKGLKQITAYLEIHDDFDTTLSFIFYILDNCSNLTDMKLFVHNDIARDINLALASRCMSRSPCVRWRWGTWKGTKDDWIKDAWIPC